MILHSWMCGVQVSGLRSHDVMSHPGDSVRCRCDHGVTIELCDQSVTSAGEPCSSHQILPAAAAGISTFYTLLLLVWYLLCPGCTTKPVCGSRRPSAAAYNGHDGIQWRASSSQCWMGRSSLQLCHKHKRTGNWYIKHLYGDFLCIWWFRGTIGI